MLRFAPSPTGDMHIGNLRAAIFNYLVAKKSKEKFIIRIEDTDIERNIANKDKEILEILKIFDLDYDELIYQSHNFPKHRDIALRLLKEGKAFYCYCSKEFLDQKRQEAIEKKIPFRYDDAWANLEKGDKTSSPIIRLKSGGANIAFKDCVKGKIFFGAKELDSFVIMRNDIPTYNFACAIDDEHMSLIIRGEDHISNTPKQILIKKAIGFNSDAKYAHLPIILNESNKKMSKRDSASSVKWLLESGLESAATTNYLILLGNSKLENKLGASFHINQAIEHFDITNVSRTSPIFDHKKLLHINRSILRSKDASTYCDILQASLINEGIVDIDLSKGHALIASLLQELGSIKELKDSAKDIFASVKLKRQKALEFERAFDLILDSMLNIDNFNQEYNEVKNLLMEKTGLKGKEFFKPFRLILSGGLSGMELDKLYEGLREYIHIMIRR